MEHKDVILIVDDQPKNLQLAATVLNPYYKLLIASNGQNAINIAKEKLPDLILLDIMMLDMSGYEVCEELKKYEKTKEIPIIFLTAKTEEADIVKGFEMGGVDYITKPFKAKEMFVRIKNQLELKRSKETINKQNQELLLLNTEKDKFFSIIAHDLKSPFTGFLSLTQMLAEELEDFSPEELKSTVIRMKNSADVLYKLLENLLQWSMIKRGLVDIVPNSINLFEIVEFNICVIKEKANYKNISLINNVEDNIVVIADENTLNTILRNLVSNAVKFTEIGGKVTITAKRIENNLIEIAVEDTGVGISEANIQKLFKLDQKFYNSGTAGETSTGLGLILCKELVEKNNGTIKVESELNKGTRFIFTLKS